MLAIRQQCVLFLKNLGTESKELFLTEQKRDSIIRQIKTDVTHIHEDYTTMNTHPSISSTEKTTTLPSP